jgi:ubiquinone/menaquinone biosynthesis C-methylase UbiE
MLRIAKEKMRNKKNITYKLGDFHQIKILPKKEFSHILCLFYTIYYTPNIKLFLDNCNYWLKPQGYLFIHVIDINKFDPVLERSSNLIPNYDPQKYTDTRITNTQLSFDTFDYQADWVFKDTESPVFEEDFDFHKLPYIRKNKHEFHYKPRKKIIKLAKKCGFVLVKVVDESTIGFKHNYMLCFQKKYGI